MPATTDPLAMLQQLEKEQGDLKKQLAIIRISEPISDVVGFNTSPSKRGSDVSISSLNDPTPASLEADLTHYKVRATLLSIAGRVDND
jgi:hypothetical protein